MSEALIFMPILRVLIIGRPWNRQDPHNPTETIDMKECLIKPLELNNGHLHSCLILV